MKLGVIGGSGIYNIENLEKIDNLSIETPFGAPSGSITYGELGGTEIYFLPRHGYGHKILPSELNHKANIYAMKKLGVTHILSISAVGSLKEEIKPKDIVFIDQFLDRTKKSSAHTFFGNGIVGHIPFDTPLCPSFRKLLFSETEDLIKEIYGPNSEAPNIVDGGTYLNIEGPAFSTKSESLLYKSWDMDVIGMTSLGEAKLAREAEICYSTAAMVTDYDCWKSDETVNVEKVTEIMKANVETSKKLIEKIAYNLNKIENCSLCTNALQGAIMTPEAHFPEKTKRNLEILLRKYYK